MIAVSAELSPLLFWLVFSFCWLVLAVFSVLVGPLFLLVLFVCVVTMRTK